MSQETYSVSLEKEQLVFSAAHFITFNGNICESLHGHNYRVKCEVEGDLDENHYVVDFIALRDSLAALVAELDHSVILPINHPTITVQLDEAMGEVLVTFENRRWVFPAEDCRLLPVANTTAELLAKYLGGKLLAKLNETGWNGIRVRLSVDENHGQWASWEWKTR